MSLAIGDSLVLRWAEPRDGDALVDFNTAIHGAESADHNLSPASWVRDLTKQRDSPCQQGVFTLVQDERTGHIVSSLGLIPQVWSYDGVPFGVGRIELVGTHPNYRQRGLVRRQMEMVHRWSEERGYLAQVVQGIPWYYRQFGYEYALPLNECRWFALSPTAPACDAVEESHYRIRPATSADVSFIAALDAHGRNRYLVTCIRDEASWLYELSGRDEHSFACSAAAVIEAVGDASGGANRDSSIGFFAHSAQPQGSRLDVTAYELVPSASWLEVTPSVLRYLRDFGQRYTKNQISGRAQARRQFDVVSFQLGGEHPVYRAFPVQMRAGIRPSAWYVRVPNLVRLVRRIAPALESRLAGSAIDGFTGELKLNFYRHGLQLSFTTGQLATVTTWPEYSWVGAGASFPELTFLQLLFGYRTLEDLERTFPDCLVQSELARVLLQVLFPPALSHVWAVA